MLRLFPEAFARDRRVSGRSVRIGSDVRRVLAFPASRRNKYDSRHDEPFRVRVQNRSQSAVYLIKGLVRLGEGRRQLDESRVQVNPGIRCAFYFGENDLLILGSFDVSEEEYRRVNFVIYDDLRSSVDRNEMCADGIIDRIGNWNRRIKRFGRREGRFSGSLSGGDSFRACPSPVALRLALSTGHR